jgi:hypothetical protein
MEEIQSSKGNIHTLLLGAGRSLVIAGASTLVLSSHNARPASKNVDPPSAESEDASGCRKVFHRKVGRTAPMVPMFVWN